MTTLGFIGLGTMGSRMARRLLDAGRRVVGYNRTRAKAQPLVAAGMRLAESPRAVAEAADVIFSMVTDTAALKTLALGADGIVAGTRYWTATGPLPGTRELDPTGPGSGASRPGGG